MSILKSQTKGYRYSSIFLASLIILGLVMTVIQWNASSHKKTPKNTTQEVSSIAPEKKISDSIPKKVISETEKKEQPVLPTEMPSVSSKQNLVAVSVDGMAMIAIHQVLPKVTQIAQSLQDNFKIFLQKPSLADYVNNQLKWEAMVKYHIKEKLVSLDASYKNKEIKEKMEKLHLLQENFEKLGKGVLKYVESQKGNLEQKTFLKLLQASNTARYAAETENIFSELSGKKCIIYERN